MQAGTNSDSDSLMGLMMDALAHFSLVLSSKTLVLINLKGEHNFFIVYKQFDDQF
jgi:hypothetical protein